jgi:uncharacterized protein
MKHLLLISFALICYSLNSQEIFDAYRAKDSKKVEQLLKNGSDPNQLDSKTGWTLMFNAAWDNNVAIMELLQSYGGKLDIECGNSKITPLLPACQENAFEAVKFLVSKGADVNRRFQAAGNLAPIRFACKTGNIELVSFLLDNGAKIEDEPDDKITPIIQAARSNHYNLVNFLIQKGANVNAYARDKECALNQAIMNKNVDIVKLLLENGAKVTYTDENGYSSIQLAKKSKNKEIIRLIEEKLK